MGWGGVGSSNSGIQSNNYSARSLHCEAKSRIAGFNSSWTEAIVGITGGSTGGQVDRLGWGGGQETAKEVDMTGMPLLYAMPWQCSVAPFKR